MELPRPVIGQFVGLGGHGGAHIHPAEKKGTSQNPVVPCRRTQRGLTGRKGPRGSDPTASPPPQVAATRQSESRDTILELTLIQQLTKSILLLNCNPKSLKLWMGGKNPKVLGSPWSKALPVQAEGGQ